MAGATLIAPLQEVDVQAPDAAATQSMTLADTQQQRMLERLRRAGDQPVTFAELRASGIAFPAVVVSELQLNGYAIDRVYDCGRLVGVRLLKPEPPPHPPHTGAPYGCGGSDNQRRTTQHDHRRPGRVRRTHRAGIGDPIASRGGNLRQDRPGTCRTRYPL